MKKIFGLLLIVLFASCGAGDKTAFVDIDKVFNEFELTKQKKAEYENTLNKRKEITDNREIAFATNCWQTRGSKISR